MDRLCIGHKRHFIQIHFRSFIVAFGDASPNKVVETKGFDEIWETVEEDKLMLTSLNKMPDSGLDLFNNGLLMTKGTHNNSGDF